MTGQVELLGKENAARAEAKWGTGTPTELWRQIATLESEREQERDCGLCRTLAADERGTGLKEAESQIYQESGIQRRYIMHRQGQLRFKEDEWEQNHSE